MTRHVITCTLQSELQEVMQLMRQYHIRHVPVVEDERPIDVISIRDVMEYRLNEMERRCLAVGAWLAASE